MFKTGIKSINNNFHIDTLVVNRFRCESDLQNNIEAKRPEHKKKEKKKGNELSEILCVKFDFHENTNFAQSVGELKFYFMNRYSALVLLTVWNVYISHSLDLR